MAEWNGKYIHPYAEHGKKSEQVKKVTVSIPINVLKALLMSVLAAKSIICVTPLIQNCCAKHFCMRLPVNHCLTMMTCAKTILIAYRLKQDALWKKWALIQASKTMCRKTTDIWY